jgi:hypothetical protein
MNKVRVTVFDQEQYDGDWPHDDALACLGWFQSKVDKIPAEYRDSATIEIDSRSGYEGSHYARIRICYWRPETPEETAERNAKIERNLRDREAQERLQLAALSAKYGS